jgi:hypothetical protein
MESDPLLPLLESVNGGKGVRIAREADLADSVACLRDYAGLADQPNGESGVGFLSGGVLEVLLCCRFEGGQVTRLRLW